MYSYTFIVTRVCERCRQPFESRSRVGCYCKACQPVIQKEAAVRAGQKRTEKAKRERQGR